MSFDAALFFLFHRLEEEEKLVTAERVYTRAIVLDNTFQEATEALEKLQIRIQESWINLPAMNT